MANKPIQNSLIQSFLETIGANSQAVVATYNPEVQEVEKEISFKYDPLDFPLKSTQQLAIDWSKFENHTFFSSAEIKINESFNNIINSFPFDGSKLEVESYLDSLTGFEKWIFEKFPTFAGALHFSGTQTNENPANGFSANLGTSITVIDKAGYLFPTLSRNNSSDTIISPDDSADKSFTIEFLIKLPEIVNSDQVILQKKDNSNNGFTLFLESTSSTSSATLTMTMYDATEDRFTKTSATIAKGKFVHVCVTLNNDNEERGQLEIYVNSVLKNVSEMKNELTTVAPKNSPLLIGSGTIFVSDLSGFGTSQVLTTKTPTQTFSGSLDELRIFDSYRNTTLQANFENKGLYSTSDLKLYYRFNEPYPLSPQTSDTINSIILDSSGNSLHSYVTNFTSASRLDVTTDVSNLMTAENTIFKKILFPGNPLVRNLNADLLLSGSDYDKANPNIITRLIPQHYLIEGAFVDGFENVDGTIKNPYEGKGIPGEGKLGSTQIMLSLLNIWAKFFDEIKMYLDSFGTLRTISYEAEDSIPDNFLEDYIKKFGFYLPRFFNTANLQQYAEGENIEGYSSNDVSLKSLQASILRRIAMVLPNIARSKGTLHSIELFLRAVGIDPNNSLKIREYGNSNVTTLSDSSAREKKRSFEAVINMTGNSLIRTQYLTGSRIEPGYPEIDGVFVYDNPASHNKKIIGTTEERDGLFTSGSWTIEGTFKIPVDRQKLISDEHKNQCLFRMHMTGSNNKSALVATVVAATGSLFLDSEIFAYFRGTEDVSLGADRPPVTMLKISLPGAGLFDGNKWNISIGRERNDSESLNALSSSLFLRVGKFENGEITTFKTTSSYYAQNWGNHNDFFSKKSTIYNASGSFITIGDFAIDSLGGRFLNDETGNVTTTDFVGQVSNLRFWSKALTVDEYKEHIRNFKSFGVQNPIVNADYETVASGSFEKLRLYSLQKQSTKKADANGEINFIDFSSSNKQLSGTGFDPLSTVITGDTFEYSQLSPRFDESTTSAEDKIRIVENEKVTLDDLRLSIEFSLLDSLDEDIIRFISSFDFLNDALGKPELQFSSRYVDLEELREVYFRRLKEKLDFRKYFDFYRWFDTSISTFIAQLLPMKTRYKGTNFVIESHMLERHKMDYKHSSVYVTDNFVPGNLFNYESATLK